MTRLEASLITDYLAFDRQRRRSRPFMQTFAGFALLTLAGGAIGSVPPRESLEAASLFVMPAAALLLLHQWRWSRLQSRLAALRSNLLGSNL